jgi:L-alanine-DL-glutamate epimerase-like enolase superfamily enzyme
VIAEAWAAGVTGLGYTYAAAEAAELINDTLAEVVIGEDAFATPKSWEAMVRSVRNLGWRGICATAISAVDVALWDLKARLLDRPLVQLLGATRSAVPIYGSGGFTSYSTPRLAEQLAGWVTQDGCQWVKMKVGSEPAQDLQRVRAARSAIGAAGLFVDANGAYTRKQALRFAEQFAEPWRNRKPAIAGVLCGRTP